MKTLIAIVLLAPTIAVAGWRVDTNDMLTMAHTDDRTDRVGIAFNRPTCTPVLSILVPAGRTVADSTRTGPVDVTFQIDRHQRWRMQLQAGAYHQQLIFLGAPLKLDVIKEISQGQSLVLQFGFSAYPRQWDLTGSARAIKGAWDACVRTTATKPAAPPARKPVWVQQDLGEVHF